jgi:hypothetical protein
MVASKHQSTKWKHSKRRGMLTKEVVLHHEIARHPAAALVKMIEKLKSEFLPHPPFSPDLTAPDNQTTQ